MDRTKTTPRLVVPGPNVVPDDRQPSHAHRRRSGPNRPLAVVGQPLVEPDPTRPRRVHTPDRPEEA